MKPMTTDLKEIKVDAVLAAWREEMQIATGRMPVFGADYDENFVMLFAEQAEKARERFSQFIKDKQETICQKNDRQ